MKFDPVLFAKAIADDTRQKIMNECCCCWVSVGDLANKLEKTQPTVSHHLAILRDANLVDIREEGKQTFYTLNQENIMICCGKLMVKFAPETETAQNLINVVSQ
jgi:ArsR family transcriptional regulator, arsenate/arsenite/antimonite-responsive transcriptional repressor